MSGKTLEMDEIDRQIFGLLESDPEMSQIEIAKQVGLSQPSVGARLRKLKTSGIISHVVGINFRKVGVLMARIDLATSDSSGILNFYEGCPRFLNGMTLSGERNLCLFFVGENMATLQANVDLHLRSNPKVTYIDFNLIVSPVKDLVFPVRIYSNKRETSPCGLKCKECSYYKADRCLGCPATVWYKGKFW